MTKKDYIAIALALRAVPCTSGRVELTDVVAAVSRVFKADNDKFDAYRFQDAVLYGKGLKIK